MMERAKLLGSCPKHCAPAGSSCLGMGQGGSQTIAWAEMGSMQAYVRGRRHRGGQEGHCLVSVHLITT